MEFHHAPIMVQELVLFLDPKPGQIIVDATAGGGGHLGAILRRCPDCRLVAIDQDEEAILALKDRFKDQNIAIVHDNFRKIVLILKKFGLKQVDAVLLDLGVSTHQLETDYRGFSFNRPAPLDMRMDNRQALTASTIINRWSAQKITKILRLYGQEPFAGQIARRIVQAREIEPIETTEQLVEIIRRATPPSYRHSRSKIHFATNTFRALRMAVNDELGALQSFLKQVLQILRPKSRLAIITFHSLEDRLVKSAMRSWSGEMTSIVPSSKEIKANPKARSARLRGFTFANPNF